MTLFGWALARTLVAACLVIVPLAMAQAAGALAIGACGAYGLAFDFAADPVARNAALRKCEGDCKVVAALSRNCAAFAVDLRNACGFHGSRTGSRQLFLALCRRYGISPYRYPRQRRSTVVLRAPRGFVEEVLWPEFKELDIELRSYLQEVTLRMIREDVFADTSEAPEVDAPPALPQR